MRQMRVTELKAKLDAGEPVYLLDVRQPEEFAVCRLPGGVLIRNADGVLLGAVGVSGDTSDNDEVCALAGIAAAGLKADTGE